MAAVSKHAWVVFGLSLFAGTASAAIPDANGVIHGCYNVLSGSTRIIDGNNCGLLERRVDWSQTGPRGPAGASVTGVSLPPNDPNCKAGGVALTLNDTTSYICNGLTAEDTTYMGWDSFELRGPFPANTVQVAYATSLPFEPTKNGTCVYNYSARFFNPVADVAFTPQLETNGGTGLVGLGYAQALFPETGSPIVQTATTAGWYVEAGQDYRPGIQLAVGSNAIPQGSKVDVAVTWVCKGGPNKATF